MLGKLLLVCTTMAALGVSATAMAETLGQKPAYLWGGISSVPNEQAITKTIWAPGLEEGFVPQGLTYPDGTVLIAAYNSSDPKAAREARPGRDTALARAAMF